jgi:hypothetical protein
MFSREVQNSMPILGIPKHDYPFVKPVRPHHRNGYNPRLREDGCLGSAFVLICFLLRFAFPCYACCVLSSQPPWLTDVKRD